MTTTKRVLVCGGRDFGNTFDKTRTDYEDKLKEEEFMLDYLTDTLPGSVTIISGGAKGADTVAIEWSRIWEEDCIIFRARWSAHGLKAGAWRNQRMLDEGKPDLVVAFPGGKGTADMVRRAKLAGVEVIEVEYN